MDADKQFNDDIEKAMALSLETQELDRIRRIRMGYATVERNTTTSGILRSTSFTALRSSSSQYEQRTQSLSGSRELGSLSSSPANLGAHSDEPDLISFSNPIEAPPVDIVVSDPAPATTNAHSKLLQMVNEMHRQNELQTQRLQLVPYTQQLPSVQQNVPLTTDHLQKLYSMDAQRPFLSTHTTAIVPLKFNGFPISQSPAMNQQSPLAVASSRMYETNVANVAGRPAGNSQTSAMLEQTSQQQFATQHIGQMFSTQATAATSQAQSSRFETTAFNNGVPRSDAAYLSMKKLPPPPQSVSSEPSMKSLREGTAQRNGRKSQPRQLGDDLIDLNHGIDNNSRVSVLEAFDPLLIQGDDDESDDENGDAASDCATSYYSEYDPFDYLYSIGTQYSDPLYEAVNKIELSPNGATQTPQVSLFRANNAWAVQTSNSFSRVIPTTQEKSAPPLPPRNANNAKSAGGSLPKAASKADTDSQIDRRRVERKLYENVVLQKTYDAELVAFYEMVKRVRSEFRCTDQRTNPGHVIACEFNNHYPEGTEIKLIVHPALADDAAAAGVERGQIDRYGPPVTFTCDICTTVEHVLLHVFCELEGRQHCSGAITEYIMKPIGIHEWLRPTSKLSQLECVHRSIKLEQDVQLAFWPRSTANLNAFGRSQTDDARDADIKLEYILANEPVDTINYNNLIILLETLEDEICKLELGAADVRPHKALSCSSVVQSVKAICTLLGSVDTLEIPVVLDELKRICNNPSLFGARDAVSGGMLDVSSEDGDYAIVSIRPKLLHEQIKYCCNRIRDSVQTLIETYSHAFRVDFCVTKTNYITSPLKSEDISSPVEVHVKCLHRADVNWSHDDFMLGVQINHGTRSISDVVVTHCMNERTGLNGSNLKFDVWLRFDSISICTLPRESRLIFVLYGCTSEPAEGGNADAGDSTQNRRITKVELCWSSIQFFEFNGYMIEGSYLLPQWPATTDKYLGPAPAKGTRPDGNKCPILSIEIPGYGGQIVYPEDPRKDSLAQCLDFTSLDRNLQQELIDTMEQGYQNAVDKREVLWEKRYYLQTFPHALPKILHTAHSWDYASSWELHRLVRSWHPLTPLQTLELFLPRYPDIVVRAQAVNWFAAITNDQLIDFLPQLLQALKHDTYEASPLAEFLLRRALESPRIAHHMFWLLVHCLPGDSPQNTNDHAEREETIITQARYNRRNQMLLRALLSTCGEQLSNEFLSENIMCTALADIATHVKTVKDQMRQNVLIRGMGKINQDLIGRPIALPLGLAHEVTALSTESCSYFNSNTLPLKISFIGPDRMILPAIFKAGDDLQQDMLTIQLVRLMDRLWLEEGLDLKMVTFNCVPTGHKRGMIEMITDAETLRKIQVEWGLTGSFKDKPIAEWLKRQNPSELEYQRAVDNFTLSCAGYSVVTYILGICDRHNDNIMLKTSGHLFHIDFGKFLGDAQMFGNFKRDRTPFVLTSDMAYVINMSDRPSIKFQHFVDLCCKAFNIVRKHGDLVLHMLALMATSGIPGVNADAVNYVRNALLPGQSNPEAAASFSKMISISLKSWFTQFNFFLHNLAQMRFSGEESNGELLSFVPRTYTMQQDGRLKSVTVHGFQKRYDVEKYYTYILKVTRQNQPDPAYLFRSYKEFSEFHQKLCMHFPLVKLHSLPSGKHVGRSNIKTVAERRLPEIRKFLISLFDSADEIAHSDLVYTFFHPILRDQKEQDIHVAKVKEPRQPPASNNRDCGEIRLSLQYHKGALTVMIHHARNLPATRGDQEPNTYVKAYLKPDPTKSTKRKTKVVRKSRHPSFMETLEYRMPLEYIQNRVLQVTVWSHDSLQENEFLGGVELSLSDLNLREEFNKWFSLGYLSRS